MLSTFNALKTTYGSREITMDDLEVIRRHDFIRFENRGISRSNLDCLLCEVYCDPYAQFLERAKGAFTSSQALREVLEESALGFQEQVSEDAELLCFQSDDGVELFASVASDGTVSIDAEDIELPPFFQVFLRVQH